MTNFAIQWTEAGAEFEGQGLTLAELNRRLSLIRDKRKGQAGAGWYYKTCVIIKKGAFEYQARLDINDRFDRYLSKSFIQDHIKGTLKAALKHRNAHNVYGKLYRELAHGALDALKLIQKEG